MAMRHIESPEGLGQFVDDPDKAKAGLARVIVEAAKAWRASYPDISLPSVVTPVETRTIAQAQETSFEIPIVSEEQYEETHKALANEGYTIVVTIEPLSIGQLLLDATTSQRFVDLNPSKNMRAIVPLQMEVAINPKNLRIKNSNSQPTDTQIRMIEDEEAGLKGKLPQELRGLISMRMQNASVLAQVDSTYQKATGEVLFTNWFGRTDDPTVPDVVVIVGRSDPSLKLRVGGWPRGNGGGNLFAVPVVVLPRKLAV